MSSHLAIPHTDPQYPRLLKEIQRPPETLWVRGAPLGDEPAIAIVGTRKPSAYGIEAAKFFSGELSRRGFTIVSGLAFGIDKASHEACLEAGGRTIAVLGSGVDRITPASHEGLAAHILQGGGAIVSEFPPGQDARPETFPQRNRIISGLSLGVVVIEAPETSGALITARYAAEQNREVFVVPGPIFSPNFRGSHALIREGATLVTKPEDVIEALGYGAPTLPFVGDTASGNLKPEANTILGCLGEEDGLTADELSRRTHLSMQELNVHLTFLEMARYIRRENEKIYLNAPR
jgi:DNA processing protein